MKEVTRVHIAKVAYDIEVAAKKQLEKYIHSLEMYTQDKEVLADIEIRITEILNERGVMAGGVIGGDDVAAVRAQLGEPHEFADGDNDMAIGPDYQDSGRRLFRSTDNAVLGGVLSGVAAYFNVNPLWTRLVFILLVFISFGTAAVVYILFWILTPAARTATEKLRMAGKTVTVESIKALNVSEDEVAPNRLAPTLRRLLAYGFGAASGLAAVGTFIGTVWFVIAGLTMQGGAIDVTGDFMGFAEIGSWVVQLLFWSVVFGLLMLATLFGLIAYAFFKRRLTKATVLSSVVVIVLGLAAFLTVVGVGVTQSVQIANESRAMVRETKAPLSREFSSVKNVTFENKPQLVNGEESHYISGNYNLTYIVDNGPARYELNGLPTTRLAVSVNGDTATVSLSIPQSIRNNFVQPSVTIYGPALASLEAGKSTTITYESQRQESFALEGNDFGSVTVSGSYGDVQVSGVGSFDLSAASIESLTTKTSIGSSVLAGTVRDLTVTHPDVCPSQSSREMTMVQVSGVAAGFITYNDERLPVQTHRRDCGMVDVQGEDSLLEAEFYQ